MGSIRQDKQRSFNLMQKPQGGLYEPTWDHHSSWNEDLWWSTGIISQEQNSADVLAQLPSDQVLSVHLPTLFSNTRSGEDFLLVDDGEIMPLKRTFTLKRLYVAGPWETSWPRVVQSWCGSIDPMRIRMTSSPVNLSCILTFKYSSTGYPRGTVNHIEQRMSK